MLLFFKFFRRSFERHDTLHKISDVPPFTTTPPVKAPNRFTFTRYSYHSRAKQEKLFAFLFPAVIYSFTITLKNFHGHNGRERFVPPVIFLLEIKLHYHFPIKEARISKREREREKQSKDRRAVSGVPRYTGMFAYSIDGYADETLRIDWGRGMKEVKKKRKI